jgi:hypothetical protein
MNIWLEVAVVAVALALIVFIGLQALKFIFALGVIAIVAYAVWWVVDFVNNR